MPRRWLLRRSVAVLVGLSPLAPLLQLAPTQHKYSDGISKILTNHTVSIHLGRPRILGNAARVYLCSEEEAIAPVAPVVPVPSGATHAMYLTLDSVMRIILKKEALSLVSMDLVGLLQQGLRSHSAGSSSA